MLLLCCRCVPNPSTNPVQVWDPVTGKLKKDLTYQAEEMFMMHEEAVLALAFNRESSVLVSGAGQQQRCCKSAGGVRVLLLAAPPYLLALG